MLKHHQFKVLVVASKAKDHQRMIISAEPFFKHLAAENRFTVDFTEDADTINDQNLAQYQVFVMLHLAPFDMTPSQQQALQRFIENGKGWVGIHAAGLTGKEFLGPHTTYWQWFEEFMGSVTYSPHPKYQEATLVIEDREHPATKNLPAHFNISDEWYEFHGNPRAKTRILCTVDEATYNQNKPMGDHPMVWVNENYHRSIYICVGHDPSALKNQDYVTLLRDSILWAASP